jgi:hypothetical protein
VSDLVRQATVGEIVEALKNAERQAPAHRAGSPAEIANAREEREVASRKPGRPAKAPVASPRAGQQRAPELLAQLMERVHSYIKAHPGQGVAPIAASLGTSTKELGLLLRKLVDQKKVTSKGKKRGTRYYPK